MLTLPAQLSRRLPGFLRDGLEKFNVLRASGLLTQPGLLFKQMRHRVAFGKLQKSLFYHRYASAVLLAHELGIFDALAQSPQSAESLAALLGIMPRSADALLRILEAQQLLLRAGDTFSLAPFAGAYLAAEGEFSVSPMLDLMAAQASAFPGIAAGVRSGTPPAILDIFAADGRYRSYLAAVNAYLDWAGRDLLSRVALPEIRSMIVGSMGVSFSALVMEKAPHARVTYGCLEHLVREIPELRRRYHVPPERVDGMHAHGGEPGSDRWGDERFDLVFLTKKMILDPEHRIGEKFAAKAFDVLQPGGVAIFWETVHADDRPTPLAQAMEAVMDLGASPAGLVNTRDSLQRLLSGIGFGEIHFIPCLNGQTTFVIGRKP